MGLVNASKIFSTLKGRPKTYKASDAAYPTGGNKGGYIAFLPKQYPKNAPQKKVAAVARECGIKKGMSKADLQKAMVDCVGPKMA